MNKVYCWSIIVALGGFLFGFDTAVISGVEKSIQDFFLLGNFMHGFTIASALLGTIVGALVAGYPIDKYGRKFVLVIVALLYTISAFGSALTSNLLSFIFFRIIGGIAVGASSVAGPMYISEISPAKVRGRMTSIFQLNVIVGILVAFISNYILKDVGVAPWRFMLGVEGIPAILFFILLYFVPESPRFLIMKGKISEAKVIFKMIGSDITYKSINISKNNNIFTKKYSKPLTIAFLVAMFNQFSGINAILYFSPRIFEMSGLTSNDSMFQPVLIGIVNGVFTIIGMIAIDRVGRKTLLIFGSIGMAISLAILSFMFFSQDFFGFGILIILLSYIMFFAFSTGTVIWVLIAEVFSNNIRGKGQSFGSFIHWFFAALITFLFPIISSSSLGSGFAFGFFSVMMILQVLTVMLYFPETKGKSLEELSLELNLKG